MGRLNRFGTSEASNCAASQVVVGCVRLVGRVGGGGAGVVTTMLSLHRSSSIGMTVTGRRGNFVLPKIASD